MRNLKLRSYYYALLLPSSSSVFTEKLRICALLLLSEQKVIIHQAQGNLLQKFPMTKLRKFRLSLYHVLPRIQLGTPNPRENLCDNAIRKFHNLPEDVKLTQISEDAGFTRSVSVGHFFVANAAVKLEGQARVESTRTLEMMKELTRKD